MDDADSFLLHYYLPRSFKSVQLDLLVVQPIVSGEPQASQNPSSCLMLQSTWPATVSTTFSPTTRYPSALQSDSFL